MLTAAIITLSVLKELTASLEKVQSGTIAVKQKSH